MTWTLKRRSSSRHLSLLITCNHNRLLLAWKAIKQIASKQMYFYERFSDDDTKEHNTMFQKTHSCSAYKNPRCHQLCFCSQQTTVTSQSRVRVTCQCNVSHFRVYYTSCSLNVTLSRCRMSKCTFYCFGTQ